MNVEPEKFEIGTPTKSEANDDDELAEGSSNMSERRIKTSVRGPATKRRSAIHDDEPGTKKIIIDDGEDIIEDMVDDSGTFVTAAATAGSSMGMNLDSTRHRAGAGGGGL